MERRSSDRDGPSPPPSNPSNPNVFDDDYEIDPDEEDFMPSVCDGFRPPTTHNTQTSRHDRPNPDQSNPQPPSRPLSITKPNNDHDLRRTATRNSTAKVRDLMPQDRRPPFNSRPNVRTSLSYRDSVTSTASFATISHSENPFENGPSHPYGMYTQNPTIRPASVATTTTEHPLRRSTSLQQPTHPYGMYSQSGLGEGDDEPLEQHGQPSIPHVQAALPVGFLGQSTGYHRVLGPDGEEQDIIGPDGHAEQLPPYSRHPLEGPTKASLAAEASAARIVPAPAPAPVDLEDPFMNPVSSVASSSPVSFSPPLLPTVTPARLPQRRPETQTGSIASTTSAEAITVPAEPSDSSSASLLATENSFSEKAEPAPAKVKWRNRKLWGKVTIGAALIALIAIVVLAIALGAAIGKLAHKQSSHHSEEEEKPHHQAQAQPASTPGDGIIYGAMPIPIPPGFSPLPTGTFSLPLGLPQDSKPGCLTQPNQYAAWSCKMTFAPLTVTINNTNNDVQRQSVSVKPGPLLPDGIVTYGLQTPQFSSQPLQLVIDLDYKPYGPAWHSSLRYDKLVVLREEELSVSPGAARMKRQNFDSVHQRFQVKAGENPWYCFWNHTFIEFYIYAGDNSSAADSTAIPLPSGTSSPATLPTDGTGTSTSNMPTSPTQAVRRQALTDTPVSSPRVPTYPRIFKLEERRVSGSSSQPYCQKMAVLDNGKIIPAPMGSQGPVSIPLQERDPTNAEFVAANSQASQSSSLPIPPNSRRELASLNQKREDPTDGCHCQWMFA